MMDEEVRQTNQDPTFWNDIVILILPFKKMFFRVQFFTLSEFHKQLPFIKRNNCVEVMLWKLLLYTL